MTNAQDDTSALSVADLTEIREVLTRYAYAIDFGDAEVLNTCFTEDAVVELSGLPDEAGHAGRGEGRAQLGHMLAHGFAANRGHSRHWVLPVLILATTEGATAITYLTVIRPGEFPQTGILMTGIYHDRLVRTDAGWRIAHRVFQADPQQPHAGSVPTDVLIERFDRATQNS
jgi:hypothetical protein